MTLTTESTQDTTLFDDTDEAGRRLTKSRANYKKVIRIVPAGETKLVSSDSSLFSEALIGDSSSMRALVCQIETAAPSDLTVLITGESGTGKELPGKVISIVPGPDALCLLQLWRTDGNSAGVRTLWL